MSTKKLPTEKALSLLGALKGKKPVVIGVSIVVFVLAALGVHYGYIPEELLNVDSIVKYVSGAFSSPTEQVVDSVAVEAVDTTISVIDSLSN
jgi:hypothetical protein